MKRRSLLLSPLALALPARAAPRHGVHGMVLFGGQEGLFGAHLPMFHAPHDVQLLLRLRVNDPAIEQAVRSTLDSNPRLWTVEPERFDLNAVQAGMRFRAKLVAGHFERGGITRWHAVELQVEDVLLQRVLDPSPPPRSELSYVRVGRFLVKEVDARPDFDHIVLLEKASGMGRLRLPRHALVAPDARSLQAASGARVRATIYYDHADLT